MELHMTRRLLATAAVLGLLSASPAAAGHHQWDFTEAYSNASGTVQFVEMIGGGNGEQNLGAWTITTGTNTLNFVTNLSSTATAGRSVLCATSNFASLPGGITPDYIVPANFFPTSGGTLTYAGGADTWIYTAVPLDGVNSRLRNGSDATNSPRNFANQTGSVDLGVTTPGFPRWGLVVLVAALLFAASGLLRRPRPTLA